MVVDTKHRIMKNTNGMKIIISGVLILISTSFYAQTPDSLRSYFLDIELSIIHPVLGGFGGTVGVERNHYSLGLMGFGTALNHSMKHYLVMGAEELKIYNWGVELYSDYYLKKEHKGLFLGAIASLNGFQFTDIPDPQTIHALFVAPRLGYRLYLPKKLNAFYFQPALSFQIKLWDNQEQFEYRKVSINSPFLLSQLTLGMKI